ncbi:MAG: S8 family serine peptidase [Cyanobacteriota bacterium]
MADDLTLQRGGETLALRKTETRFTARPQAPEVISTLAQQVTAQCLNQIPVGSRTEAVLLEFEVAEASQLTPTMDRTRDRPDVAFVSHVYSLVDNPGTLVYLADDLTIEFAESVSQPARQALTESLGLGDETPLVGLDHAFIYRVTREALENPIKIANRLIEREDILAAEPNIVTHSAPSYRPSDRYYPQQWYLNHHGGPDLAPDSHIAAEQAWDITRGDRSIVVAIADDAIDLNHPDFQGIGKIVAPRDFRNRDGLPLPERDSDNHGTACAGVCLAEETGEGIVGIAPGCALMPLATTGYLDDRSIEELFDWAIERGASVISCSWGASAVYFRLSMRQRAALTRAARLGRHGKGAVIVFAAGNANRPTQGEINEQGWTQNILSGTTKWLSGFAAHPEVIAVSACTSLNQKAAYSNWGQEISVCAPSNNAPPGIWLQETGYVNTAPVIRKSLLGKGVFTSDRSGDRGYSPSDYTHGFGGTSSACPLVAGVAALVLSVNPNLTAAEVKAILEKTADKIVDPESDPQLGTRFGQYDGDGHSKWFGYGKVNAYQAVLAAKQQSQVPLSVTRRVRGRNERQIAIPDGDANGITSPIRVRDRLTVVEVEITLELDHPDWGDVEVMVLTPEGETVMLQGRGIRGQGLFRQSYDFNNTPQLKRLLGRSAEGNWALKVCDRAAGDTGVLNFWQLTVGLGS